MDTIKCPNCYQKVSTENRFCIFCGYDLSEEMMRAEAEPMETAVPETHEAVSEGSLYCPNGHLVTDSSLGFCPTCGSSLTGASGNDEPAAGKDSRSASRTCSCGYVCDDPELSFCPACGLPFGSTAHVEEPGWVCACGTENPSDSKVCAGCGNPRGWIPVEAPKVTPEPEASVPDASIPDGMMPLGENDLTVRAKYGN